MTGEERYQLVLAKLNRARHHMDELVGAVKEYLEKEPYKLGFRIGEDARPTYFVETVENVPALIPTVLGDVLHNLRCCLDHLAYQLVWVETGSPPTNTNQLYFPLCESEAKYNHRKKGGDAFFQNVAAATIAIVDSLKPYKGGNDHLWLLHKLNNVDKHRMLITAGGMAGSVDLGLSYNMKKLLEQNTSFPEKVRQGMLHAIEMDAKEPLFYKVDDPMFPLKAGDVFLYDMPGNGFNPDVKLKVYLAFGEVGITQAEPMDKLLHVMGEAVATAINTLRPCLG